MILDLSMPFRSTRTIREGALRENICVGIELLEAVDFYQGNESVNVAGF